MEIQMEKLLQLIGEQVVELMLYKHRIQDMAARVAELEKELDALKSCPKNTGTK